MRKRNGGAKSWALAVTLMLCATCAVKLTRADLAGEGQKFASNGEAGTPGEIEDEGQEQKIMVWVEVNACETESDECWNNDGPHPVISYDSSAMDQTSMHVEVAMDGRLLATLREPSGDATIIMRSPHEQQVPNDGQHFVEARIVSLNDGALLARHSVSFVFDLRSKPWSSEGKLAPCAVMPGGNVSFAYRGGDGHGSHQAVLYAAFHATSGPVIEFGMGYFSTPMLHELCAAAGRQLVSIDTDDSWVSQFRHLETEWHAIVSVTQWENIPQVEPFYARDWGLAFIDQHPESARIQVARRIKARTNYIVMHDAYRQLGQPGFGEYADEFKHFREYFPPRPFAGTQFTYFTGTRVQVLTSTCNIK